MVSLPRKQTNTKSSPCAYEIGKWDAEQGYTFAPESYYANRNDKALYALGYLTIEPDNAAANAYMRHVEESDIELVTYNRYGDIVR